MTDSGRRQRPHVVADVERLAAARHSEPLARIDLAHATAAVVVRAGRDPQGQHTGALLDLADTVGLDTLAELYFRHGNTTKAIEVESRAATIDPKSQYLKDQIDRFRKGSGARQ